MYNRFEHRAAAALMAAGLLATAGPVVAATVVQTADFSHFHPYTINLPQFDTNDTAVTRLHFDPFDSALGTLTGVRWRLRSMQDYGTIAEARSRYNFSAAATDFAPFGAAGSLDLGLVSQILLMGNAGGDPTALMLAGLGLAGTALRRRRPVAA